MRAAVRSSRSSESRLNRAADRRPCPVSWLARVQIPREILEPTVHCDRDDGLPRPDLLRELDRSRHVEPRRRAGEDSFALSQQPRHPAPLRLVDGPDLRHKRPVELRRDEPGCDAFDAVLAGCGA